MVDAVVVVSDAATGAPVLVVIVEPQGRDEPTKEFSWPVYITAVRRAVQCWRAFLLVICPDPGETLATDAVTTGLGRPGVQRGG